jgi:hypothetical protein
MFVQPAGRAVYRTSISDPCARCGAARRRRGGVCCRRDVEQARDALEAIEVTWTPLPAAIGLVNAVKKGAPQVWPDHAGNVLFDIHR